LRERQFDGIRIGQQSVTITCVGKGRPQLQFLKLFLFGGNRLANQKIPHSALSYTGKNKLGLFDGWQAGVVVHIGGRNPVMVRHLTGHLLRITFSVTRLSTTDEC
jgi:hypothetical protein